MLYPAGETIKRSIVDDVVVTLDRMWRDEFEQFAKSPKISLMSIEVLYQPFDLLTAPVSRAEGTGGSAITIHVKEDDTEEGAANFVTKKLTLAIQFSPPEGFEHERVSSWYGEEIPEQSRNSANVNINADYYFAAIERALMKDRNRNGTALNTFVSEERTSDLLDTPTKNNKGQIEAYSVVEVLYRQQQHQTGTTVLQSTVAT